MESQQRPVVILGAGFSRAVSAHMPVMNELRDAVTAKLKLPASELAPFSGDLEVWLSALALEQPWHDAIGVLRSKELFLAATQAIGDVIALREKETIGSPPPDWLLRLVAHWAVTNTTIITFNYDQLVERALGFLRIADHVVDLYRGPLSLRGIAGGLRIGSPEPAGPVPAVLKLHGSINWGYNPRFAEAPLVLMDASPSWRTPEMGRRESPRNIGIYDDLEPLIVPPTGSKGSYYSGAPLRVQWRQAAASLRAAASVTIIGYSFPRTDFTSRLFASEIPERAVIEVVDYNASMATDIRDFLPGRTVLQHECGADAVEQYVKRVAGDLYLGDVHYQGNRPVAHLTKNGAQIPCAPDNEDHDVREAMMRSLSEASGISITEPATGYEDLGQAHLWNRPRVVLVTQRSLSGA